ncbi:MAG: glycosyltransferase, partial [Anaerolineaceae bacterium]|nr:glycosyltransferase [Anaerolineaceae bacterium]
MLKTLQITGDSPYGGAGYLLLRWCKYLLEKDWEVHVQATNPFWVSELKKVSGVRVIDDVYIPRPISPLRDLSALIQLIKLIWQEHYDVIQTYTATPGFVGRIAARLAGAPVILNHQAGWTVNEFSPAWKRLAYTPLEYLATAVSTKDICVSYAVEQQGRALGIAPVGKLVVICNGIDPKPFICATENGARERMRQDLGIPDNHLLIGNTGRLSPQKDNASLIEGIGLLRSMIPEIPFTLMLAGDGPDSTALETMISQCNLGDRVRLMGFVREIPEFLAALDIFVSPSLWEGLSISILESMAAAKP